MNLLHIHQQPAVYLVVAAFLFAAGLYGLMCRRTFIGMLISGEIVFAAAGLNFMVVNRFFAPDPAVGQVFVLFIMGLAAAEVAIVLSIIVALYRNYQSIRSRDIKDLQG